MQKGSAQASSPGEGGLGRDWPPSSLLHTPKARALRHTSSWGEKGPEWVFPQQEDGPRIVLESVKQPCPACPASSEHRTSTWDTREPVLISVASCFHCSVFRTSSQGSELSSQVFLQQEIVPMWSPQVLNQKYWPHFVFLPLPRRPTRASH